MWMHTPIGFDQMRKVIPEKILTNPFCIFKLSYNVKVVLLSITDRGNIPPVKEL